MATNFCPNCGIRLDQFDEVQNNKPNECPSCHEPLPGANVPVNRTQIKRLFLVVACVALVVIGSWWLSTAISKINQVNHMQEVSETLQPKIIEIAQGQAKQIQTLVTKFESTRDQIQTLVATSQPLTPPAIEEVHKIQAKWLNEDSNLLNVYSAYNDKLMVLDPVQELPADYDPTLRPWYDDVVQNPITQWTDPYQDITDDKMIVSISAPIMGSQGASDPVGVFAIDFNLTLAFQSIPQLDEAFIQVVNKAGTVVYSNMPPSSPDLPNQLKLDVAYEHIEGALDATQKSTLIQVTSSLYPTSKKTIIVAPIENTDYFLVALVK